MTSSLIPWREEAVAVRRLGDGEVTILFEGTLLEVVQGLIRSKATRLADVRVSLPNRQVAPRSFDGAALIALMDKSTAVPQPWLQPGGFKPNPR